MSPPPRSEVRGSPIIISACDRLFIFLCSIIPGVVLGIATLVILYLVLITVDERLDLALFRERYPVADAIFNALVYLCTISWVFRWWCRRVKGLRVLRLAREEEVEKLRGSTSPNRPSQKVPPIDLAPAQTNTTVPEPSPLQTKSPTPNAAPPVHANPRRPRAREEPMMISTFERFVMFLLCIGPGITIAFAMYVTVDLTLLVIDPRLDLAELPNWCFLLLRISLILLFFLAPAWLFSQWCHLLQNGRVLRLAQAEEPGQPGNPIGLNRTSQGGPLPPVTNPAPAPANSSVREVSPPADTVPVWGRPMIIATFQHLFVKLCISIRCFIFGIPIVGSLYIQYSTINSRPYAIQHLESYPVTYRIFFFLFWVQTARWVFRSCCSWIQPPTLTQEEEPGLLRTLAKLKGRTALDATPPQRAKDPKGPKVISALDRLHIFFGSLIIGPLLGMLNLVGLGKAVTYTYPRLHEDWPEWSTGAVLVLFFLFSVPIAFWVFCRWCNWLRDKRLLRLAKEGHPEQWGGSRTINTPSPQVTTNQPIGPSTETSVAAPVQSSLSPQPPPPAPTPVTPSTTLLSVPDRPSPQPLVPSAAPVPASAVPSVPDLTSVVPPRLPRPRPQPPPVPPPPPPRLPRPRPQPPPVPPPPPPPAPHPPRGITAPPPEAPESPPAAEEPLAIAELPAPPVVEVSDLKQRTLFEPPLHFPEQERSPELGHSHNGTPKETELVVLLPCNHLCETPWDGIGSFTCPVCGGAVWEIVGQAKD